MKISECYQYLLDNGDHIFYSPIATTNRYYKLIMNKDYPLRSYFEIELIKPNGIFNFHYVCDPIVIKQLEEREDWDFHYNFNFV